MCLMFWNWPLVTWHAELTPPAGLSHAEKDQFTLLQLFLQLFRFEGKALANEIKWESSKNREGRVQRSCFLRSLMLQLAWIPDVFFASFKHGDRSSGILALLSIKTMCRRTQLAKPCPACCEPDPCVSWQMLNLHSQLWLNISSNFGSFLVSTNSWESCQALKLQNALVCSQAPC